MKRKRFWTFQDERRLLWQTVRGHIVFSAQSENQINNFSLFAAWNFIFGFHNFALERSSTRQRFLSNFMDRWTLRFVAPNWKICWRKLIFRLFLLYVFQRSNLFRSEWKRKQRENRQFNLSLFCVLWRQMMRNRQRILSLLFNRPWNSICTCDSICFRLRSINWTYICQQRLATTLNIWMRIEIGRSRSCSQFHVIQLHALKTYSKRMFRSFREWIFNGIDLLISNSSEMKPKWEEEEMAKLIS